MDGQTRRTHSSRPEHLRRPDTRPIGVFDSGVGGLTVLHECLVNLPHEDFVYLGDTGSFPYGPRTIEDVRGARVPEHIVPDGAGSQVDRRGLQLRHRGGACRSCRRRSTRPSWAWSCPGRGRRCRRRATGGSGSWPARPPCGRPSYQQALQTLDAGLDVYPVACPRLAPLIQEGDVFVRRGGRGGAAATWRRSRRPGCDTVILGCTHYPLITPMLRRLLGPGVSLINSAEEIAQEVIEMLERKGIGNLPDREGRYRFFSTGDPEAFRVVGARFLQLPIREVSFWAATEREARQARMTPFGERRPATAVDRGPTALRDLRITPGFMPSADGSVLFELGFHARAVHGEHHERAFRGGSGGPAGGGSQPSTPCCPVRPGTAPRGKPSRAGRVGARSRSSGSSGAACGR